MNPMPESRLEKHIQDKFFDGVRELCGDPVVFYLLPFDSYFHGWRAYSQDLELRLLKLVHYASDLESSRLTS